MNHIEIVWYKLFVLSPQMLTLVFVGHMKDSINYTEQHLQDLWFLDSENWIYIFCLCG